MRYRALRANISILLVLSLILVGCGTQKEIDPATYFVIDSNREYEAYVPVLPHIECKYSNQYAVLAYSEHVASNATVKLCINNTENEIVSAENAFDKIYPASITKIMTALLVIENGNLSDTYTLNEPISLGDPMAVSLDLAVGDTITVEELLYGLLLESANDYAVALGRYLAGSDVAFVEMMNNRAKELGATHTHFVNSNGLHDEEHYTTGYDLYLIFRQLVTYEEFRSIAGQPSHTITYKNASGNDVSHTIGTSNMYVAGEVSAPEGIRVLCGKTGTTSEAGCCLIILSQDEEQNEYITVVCGTSNRNILYSVLNQELSKINAEEEASD